MGQPFGAVLNFSGCRWDVVFLKKVSGLCLLQWVQKTDGFKVIYMINGGLMTYEISTNEING